MLLGPGGAQEGGLYVVGVKCPPPGFLLLPELNQSRGSAVTSLQKGECHDFHQVAFLGQFWGALAPHRCPAPSLALPEALWPYSQMKTRAA